jgi:hypothetical protein
MSLDGLRAWIGEVERKLDMRTKVMLALAAIAIGGAAVGIYLAIDTRENAVSEKDVQELQAQLEEQIATGGGGAGVAALEAEVDALQAQVAELEAGRKGGQGSSGPGTGTGGAGGAPGGVVPGLPTEPGTVTPEEK